MNSPTAPLSTRDAISGEVLIVEDNPASLAVLSEILTLNGYAVRQAPDGELALWTAVKRPPELILLDIRMPGIDGFDVCRRLKADAATAAIPIIFLSALDAVEERVKGLRLGAVDYIGKPYQAEEVLARVHTHITLARLHKAFHEVQGHLEKQLEQARKLEALGKVTGGVVHDFNSLLGAILGYAQFIVDDSDPENPQAGTLRQMRRYARSILKAGLQAKGLINQILTFPDRHAATVERVDLATMIEENRAVLQAIVAPNTTLVMRKGGKGQVVAVPGSQIMQILVNLVSNASAAFSGEAGLVTLKVGDVDPKRSETLFSPDESDGFHHVRVGQLNPESRYTRLTIADNAAGMTLDILSSIFDPFFTTKGKTGGTGLGLSVVKDIIIAHQGGLLVHTAPGKGTRFDIFFPTVDAVSTPLPAPPMRPVKHSGSVLLVDDSADFADMLMIALSRLGYVVSVCDDPVVALGFIEEDPAAWDLLITDQVMPQMTGLDLVASIKRLRPDLPCIICSSASDEVSEEIAYRAGADGYAAKPPDLSRLSLLVKALIGDR